MEQDRRYGTENSRPYIFPPERTVNVDTEEDWYIAEYRMRKLKEWKKHQLHTREDVDA